MRGKQQSFGREHGWAGLAGLAGLSPGLPGCWEGPEAGLLSWLDEVKCRRKGGTQEGSGLMLKGDWNFTKPCGRTQ